MLGTVQVSPTDWLIAVATLALVLANISFWIWTVRKERLLRYPAPQFVSGKIERSDLDSHTNYWVEVYVANLGDVPILLAGANFSMKIDGISRFLPGGRLVLSTGEKKDAQTPTVIPQRSTAKVRFLLGGFVGAEQLEPTQSDECESCVSVVMHYMELSLVYLLTTGSRWEIIPVILEWEENKKAGVLKLPGEMLGMALPRWLLWWPLRRLAALYMRTILSVRLWWASRTAAGVEHKPRDGRDGHNSTN